LNLYYYYGYDEENFYHRGYILAEGIGEAYIDVCNYYQNSTNKKIVTLEIIPEEKNIIPLQ
jgi:hypothetical protein